MQIHLLKDQKVIATNKKIAVKNKKIAVSEIVVKYYIVVKECINIEGTVT